MTVPVCRRGHDLTRDNIMLSSDGSRRCRTCKRLSRNNSSAKTKAATAEKRAEYAKRNYATGASITRIRGVDPTTSRPSIDVLEKARIRALAPPRDLAGMFFNDPPVGYSALDLRGGK